MVLLDGIEYDVKEPNENADDLITYINTYCQTNQIKNSLGEVIYIDKNEMNPFYQLCFGLGYLTTILQKLVYSAGCSMSLAEASSRQLLNLADIAGIQRIAPTKTIIPAIVQAADQDVGVDDLIITTDDYATVSIAGKDVEFHPSFDIVVPPGQSAKIILIADQYGSFNITANTITSFDAHKPFLKRMITDSSTPGRNEESIASLRERLQRRTIEGTQIERTATAIQNLSGVAMCNIFFNYSSQYDTTVPYGDSTITVPPRQALLFVHGWSEDISKVFYRYLSCETAGSSVPEAQLQYYTTKANQNLPVYIIPPKTLPVYIRVFIKNILSYEQEAGIKDVICNLASDLTIGSSITAVDVTNMITSVYSNLRVQGAEISLTGEDDSWSYIQTAPVASLFTMDTANITIEGL